MNSGPVSASYSTGNVRGSEDTGGLVGVNSGLLSACYATGQVLGSYDVGGLAGTNAGTILHCFTLGRVSINGTYAEDVGALAGVNQGDIVASFYYIGACSCSNNDAGIALTRAQMQTKQPYVDSGWDFNTVWTICSEEETPRLQWEKDSCN